MCIENWICKNQIASLKAAQATTAIAQAKNTLLSDTIDADNNKITQLNTLLAQAQVALKASDSQNAGEIADLQTANAALQSTVDSQAQSIEALYAQVDRETDFTSLPAAIQTIILGYESKYPEAEVTYAGRDIPNQVSKIYDMHVQNWAACGINCPEATTCINQANSYVVDIVKNQNVSFHRACDLAVMQTKIWVTRGFPYLYESDSSTTSMNEYWKVFWEIYYSMQKYNIGDDCDGWAVVNYVLCRTAGVPKELLRIAAGTTRGGDGHCTNDYFASDAKWHHINSTTPYTTGDVLNLPLLSDPNDTIGLESTWFSFNEKQSWTGVESTTSGDTLENFEKRIGKKLTVVPKILRNVIVKRK